MANTTERVKIAEKIADAIVAKMDDDLKLDSLIGKANVWSKGDHVRIYFRKGFAIVDRVDAINIDRVGGHLCMDIKDIIEEAGYKTYR